MNSEQDFEEYEELEDDFVLLANENQPALVSEDAAGAADFKSKKEKEAEDEESGEDYGELEDYEDDSDADRDFANKDVKFFDDMPDAGSLEDKEVREYRLRMVALLDQMEKKKQTVPSKQLQEDLDAQFEEFFDKEYADDQIGELDEDEAANR